MASISNAAPIRLGSWKEIAAYLGRGLRTVQRWERTLQLPVHRIGAGMRSPVYALTGELNFWISTSGARRPQQSRPVAIPRGTGSPVEDSRRLTSNLRTLARSVAENSVRQRRQAEILQRRILEMRSRVMYESPGSRAPGRDSLH